MKTIGLIGGTGWVSTVEYYKQINEGINKALGGMEFANCVLYSLNYGDIDRLNKTTDLEGVYQLISHSAHKLMATDVDAIVLCANTLHMFADRLQKEINVPIIHIAEATAMAIKTHGMHTVGLLGTLQTMEKDFYKSRLTKHGIKTLVPEKEDQLFINRTIVKELFKSQFLESSRNRFLNIIEKLRSQGAQGVILGCTEIPLLIKQDDCDLQLFDTLNIHSEAIVSFAIESNS